MSQLLLALERNTVSTHAYNATLSHTLASESLVASLVVLLALKEGLRVTGESLGSSREGLARVRQAPRSSLGDTREHHLYR